MSNPEVQVTINWDELALVRPISATSSPLFTGGAAVALEPSPEFPATINWDELALVRPISATSSPLFTSGVAIALEPNPEFPATIDWDELALVRPISATSSPLFTIGAGIALETAGTPFADNALIKDLLIKDLLIKLGEAKDLKIFAVEKSGAIGADIGIASIADLPIGHYQVIDIQGGPDTSGGFGMILLSSPNGEWDAILIQTGALAGGGASVTAAAAVEIAPEAYAGYGSGVELEIIPVGFSGEPMVLL